MEWVIIGLLLILIGILVLLKRDSGFTSIEIPKTIWTYWHEDTPPEIVQKSIENWKKYSPGFEVILVTPSNIKNYISDKDFDDFRKDEFIHRRVDLIRLYLLYKFGGIWSDATIAVRKSHQWILDEQKQRGFEFFGYYRKGSTTKPDYPVIENWLFACIPGSEFVRKWRDEFERTAQFSDITKYLDDVKSQGVDYQEIPDPGYLTPYVSVQYVMQKQMTPDEIKSKIYVLESDDGPFQHSTQNNWDPTLAVRSLCERDPSSLPDVIKIYGNERRAIESDSELKCSYKIFD